MKFAMTVQEKGSLLIQVAALQRWHFITGDHLGKFDYGYNKVPAFHVKRLDTLDESTCIL